MDSIRKQMNIHILFMNTYKYMNVVHSTDKPVKKHYGDVR